MANFRNTDYHATNYNCVHNSLYLFNQKLIPASRLPYTRAVILEVLRLSSTSPFGNFHYSVEDYKHSNGMVIPQGTVVIGNLYGVHHDPSVLYSHHKCEINFIQLRL